tara:strand:- start:135 stop:371 length:237 start_codon:yes stop_codon:yes gene_type:complete
MNNLRILIRKLLIEELKKNVLGEPDSSTEKHRDEPQPQYDIEEEEDQDEASTVGGIAGYVGPLGGSGYGPGNKPYGKK